MITLHSVTKTVGKQYLRTVVLEEVSWVIPPKSRWVILGQRRSGRSTLINVIKGALHPTSGWIERRGSICPGGGFLRIWPALTPRQLMYRLSRIYGVSVDDIVSFTIDFGELDRFIDLPVASLPRYIRRRLVYSLVYALPFDLYLFDGALGPRGEFSERCRQAFDVRSKEAATIVTTYSPRVAQRLEGRGGVLHGGKLTLFDSIDKALNMFNALPKPKPELGQKQIEDEAEEFEDSV